MKLIDVITPSEKKRMIYYSEHDGSTAVTRAIPVQHVVGNIYLLKEQNDNASFVSCLLFAYFDEQQIGITIGSAREDFELDKLAERAIELGYDTIHRFFQKVDESVANGTFVSNADIALAQYYVPEKQAEYIKARQAFKEKKRQERARRDAEYEERLRQQQNRTRVAAEAQVAAAVDTIRAGGQINNDRVYYIAENGEERETCLINYLCTLYNYPMPLKVKGWINKSLTGAMIKNGMAAGYTYCGRESKTFFDHMGNLCSLIIAGGEKSA